MDILCREEVCFTGSTSLAELKRSLQTLVKYLFCDHSFSHGGRHCAVGWVFLACEGWNPHFNRWDRGADEYSSL